MFVLSIGTSLFEVLPLCFRKSHYLKKLAMPRVETRESENDK